MVVCGVASEDRAMRGGEMLWDEDTPGIRGDEGERGGGGIDLTSAVWRLSASSTIAGCPSGERPVARGVGV